jgi:hypothetical protein
MMKVEATGVGASRRRRARRHHGIAHCGGLTTSHRAALWLGSAENYYERCRPTWFMAGIRIPTLYWARWTSMDSGALYNDYDWASNPLLTIAFARTRWACRLHGTSQQPWSDLARRGFERG